MKYYAVFGYAKLPVFTCVEAESEDDAIAKVCDRAGLDVSEECDETKYWVHDSDDEQFDVVVRFAECIEEE